MSRPIISWSFSRLNDFKTCPYKYFMVHVQKAIGDANENNVRGEDYHKEFELYVARGKPLPAALSVYKPVLDKLKAKPGQMGTEVSLTLDANYQPCAYNDWNNAWVRAKADWTLINGNRGWLIDYKFGKHKKDPEQNALGAALLMHHHPQIQSVTTNYWFVLHNRWEPDHWRREDIPTIWNMFLPHVNKLAASKVNNDWPKIQGPLCGWCPVKTCAFNTMDERLARENASKEPS